MVHVCVYPCQPSHAFSFQTAMICLAGDQLAAGVCGRFTGSCNITGCRLLNAGHSCCKHISKCGLSCYHPKLFVFLSWARPCHCLFRDQDPQPALSYLQGVAHTMPTRFAKCEARALPLVSPGMLCLWRRRHANLSIHGQLLQDISVEDADGEASSRLPDRLESMGASPMLASAAADTHVRPYLPSP